jgi:hypothetical protein
LRPVPLSEDLRDVVRLYAFEPGPALAAGPDAASKRP